MKIKTTVTYHIIIKVTSVTLIRVASAASIFKGTIEYIAGPLFTKWTDVLPHDLVKSSWCHDDVIKWKHFPRYWPFVRGIHRSPVNSPHKGQWRGALMFCLICAWINGWVNNGEAGDWRRHHAHYNVIVMARFGFRLFESHWNLTGSSAQRCWDACQISERNSATSRDLAWKRSRLLWWILPDFRYRVASTHNHSPRNGSKYGDISRHMQQNHSFMVEVH